MACAPDVRFATVPVHENVEIARQIYRMRFEFPEMAAAITPGQFFMLRIAGTTDPLIGRAFALYDTVCTDHGPWGVDFAYLVAGNLTQRLKTLTQGDIVEVWGPLGNGFPTCSTDHLIMAAGGIGYTPFLAVAKEAVGLKRYGSRVAESPSPRVTFCYGARRASGLAGIDDFEGIGVPTLVATDDGSRGARGPVTEPLKQLLDAAGDEVEIYCCGPEPMMHAVSNLAAAENITCLVSLESPMACGIGICFSCVAAIHSNSRQDWDYQRTCVDGPVFPAKSVVWDQM